MHYLVKFSVLTNYAAASDMVKNAVCDVARLWLGLVRLVAWHLGLYPMFVWVGGGWISVYPGGDTTIGTYPYGYVSSPNYMYQGVRLSIF